LFPSKRIAENCRAFILDRSSETVLVRLVQFLICPEDKESNKLKGRGCYNTRPTGPLPCAELHIVLFPAHALPVAKQFWQHSGTGISSRLADYCLSILSNETEPPRTPPPVASRFTSKNKHYFVNGSGKSFIDGNFEEEVFSKDQNVYLEERYGRNLGLSFAPSAKRALRRRIAGVLASDSPEQCPDVPFAGEEEAEIGPSSRGVSDVSENDVYLFPTGMSAIWNAHQLALAVRPAAKSVCFGYVSQYLNCSS
jgi:cystathionine gamma-synthase